RRLQEGRGEGHRGGNGVRQGARALPRRGPQLRRAGEDRRRPPGGRGGQGRGGLVGFRAAPRGEGERRRGTEPGHPGGYRRPHHHRHRAGHRRKAEGPLPRARRSAGAPGARLRRGPVRRQGGLQGRGRRALDGGDPQGEDVMRPEGPWRWAAGGVLAAAIACAGTPAKPLPGYMVNAAAADNPRYPRARYLVAVGISSASFEDAAAKAQAEIAAQISAQVQSEVASFQAFVAGSGESERVTQNISVKSAWKHGERILVGG